jgi:ATP-binding cassette, subfamily F, member 3
VVLEMKAPAVAVGSADEPAGARTLIAEVDLVLERGEKVALVGPNGAGKTTLVETVAGLRSVADGAVHLGHNVRPAYYSQQGRELREERTMLENVLPLTGHDEEAARRLLGRFLFTADEVEKKVEVLSGGERSRLRLLRLLVGEANFLLLDEPTNHLDVTSVDALADGLDDYSGTLLLVTHDRHLIDRVAGRVLEIHDGRLLAHLSPQRYWEARASRTAAGDGGEGEAPASGATSGARKGSATRGAAPSVAPAGAAKTRQRSAEETRRQRARLRAAEAAVLKLERRLGEIDAELAEPETYADRDVLDRLLDERSRVEDELRREYEDWSRLVDAEA